MLSIDDSHPARSEVEKISALPQAKALRISYICLLLIALLVPIAMGNLSIFNIPGFGSITYDQFDLVKKTLIEIFVLVALFFYILSLLFEGTRLRLSPVFLFLAFFLVWVSIATLTSIDPEISIFGKYRRYEGFLAFLMYALVAFLSLQLIDTKARLRLLLWMFLFSSTLVAMYGLMQALGLDPISWGSLSFESKRAFSTYGNPNMLGSFIVMPLTIAFGFALFEKHQVLKSLAWFLFYLYAIVCLVTFTRGAWLGAFIGCVSVCVMAFRCKLRPSRIDFMFAAALLLVLIAVVAISVIFGEDATNVWTRLTTALSGTGSASTRKMIANSALLSIQERPFFGWGPDTFRLVSPLFKDPAYSQAAGALSVADNAHNWPLQLASGIGIPGTVLLYLYFAGVLIHSHKNFDPELSASIDYEIPILASAVVAYLIDMFFGLSLTGTTSFLFMFCGVLAGYGCERMAGLKKGIALNGQSVIKLLIALFSSVFMALGLFHTFKTFAADFMFYQAHNAKGHVKVNLITDAITLNPYNDYYRSQAAFTQYGCFLDTLGEYNKLVIEEGRASAEKSSLFDDLQESKVLSEQMLLYAHQKTPYEFDNFVFLTSFYNTIAKEGVQDSADSAQKALTVAEQGVSLVPNGVALLMQYAIALEVNGRQDQALEIAKRAADLDTDYKPAWKKLKNISDTAGDKKMAAYAQKNLDRLE
ncbi:MAG: O-antigen ligase family protein [Coriobacteriia bacterium]|nr:O-antigen ligase family protein [Coriobacteriia bacterium]